MRDPVTPPEGIDAGEFSRLGDEPPEASFDVLCTAGQVLRLAHAGAAARRLARAAVRVAMVPSVLHELIDRVAALADQAAEALGAFPEDGESGGSAQGGEAWLAAVLRDELESASQGLAAATRYLGGAPESVGEVFHLATQITRDACARVDREALLRQDALRADAQARAVPPQIAASIGAGPQPWWLDLAIRRQPLVVGVRAARLSAAGRPAFRVRFPRGLSMELGLGADDQPYALLADPGRILAGGDRLELLWDDGVAAFEALGPDGYEARPSATIFHATVIAVRQGTELFVPETIGEA